MARKKSTLQIGDVKIGLPEEVADVLGAIFQAGHAGHRLGEQLGRGSAHLRLDIGKDGVTADVDLEDDDAPRVFVYDASERPAPEPADPPRKRRSARSR
jgi:hypothetical protein